MFRNLFWTLFSSRLSTKVVSNFLFSSRLSTKVVSNFLFSSRLSTKVVSNFLTLDSKSNRDSLLAVYIGQSRTQADPLASIMFAYL